MWTRPSLPGQSMDQNTQNSSGAVPKASAELGTVRNDSESFRTVPNASEPFGTLPKVSESFRTIPNASERKENHTLTVREAARMFESAGVARTERSIVNWCQPNRTGIARLDSYFDPNERKYYLTPESVERAIQEEIQKAAKNNEPSETVRTVPKDAEKPENPGDAGSEGGPRQIRELEREVMDLKIANRGKDMFIERLQGERDTMFNQLLDASRKVGELETKLLQLEGPKAGL